MEFFFTQKKLRNQAEKNFCCSADFFQAEKNQLSLLYLPSFATRRGDDFSDENKIFFFPSSSSIAKSGNTS